MNTLFWMKKTSCFFLLFLLLTACNGSADKTQTSNTPEIPTPQSQNSLEENPPSNPSGGVVRFTNIVDGGSITATMVDFEKMGEKPLVEIEVEASGLPFLEISLRANNSLAVDPSGRVVEVSNQNAQDPFIGKFSWWPQNGAGEYTLTALAVDENKQIVETAIHITVVGVPAFTPTPPPLTYEQASLNISDLIFREYGIRIPEPALQRFDFADMPHRSRWIGSAFYKDNFYYVDLFDDQHTEFVSQMFPCKPAGEYKILIVFVDYGNVPGIIKEDFLAEVPVMIDWVNQLYTEEARNRGMASSPLKLAADAVFISPPPAPGELITVDQIKTLSGSDPEDYEFVIEIDIDANNSYANKYWPGLFTDVGGGLALQGCSEPKDPNTRVNIWSSMDDPEIIQGALNMDLTHELSHLFGMMDSWPFTPGGLTLPNGTMADHWIPFTMFGWVDTGNDGIPEVLDSTPYGTSG